MAAQADHTYHPQHATTSQRSGIENADIHASSDEYAARFGSAIGEWMLAAQERALFNAIDLDCASVLDVGGGHGQIAIPLATHDHSVTVVGSSPVCAQRLTQFIESGAISFKVGNLIELPYSDRSFSLATSFRLISHCANWRTLVAELCRVADHSVIIDYPVWHSVNIFAPLLFSIKKRIEGNTRTYRMFSTSELRREFKKHGFILEQHHKLFFWPMAVHRLLNNVKISAFIESIPRSIGITYLLGSPVIAKFVRGS